MSALTLAPLDFPTASAFIAKFHRHNVPPQGWKFGVAAMKDGQMVGVITVGRPIARASDDGFTLEVNRCCTDGTKNACSLLYSAAWRAAKALGYRRLITYTLATENGASLRAANWRLVGLTRLKDPEESWIRDGRKQAIHYYPTGQKKVWEAR